MCVATPGGLDLARTSEVAATMTPHPSALTSVETSSLSSWGSQPITEGKTWSSASSRLSAFLCRISYLSRFSLSVSASLSFPHLSV